MLTEKAKSEEIGTNIFNLFKYVMDEKRKTDMVLKSISENLERIESNLTNSDYYEQEDQGLYPQENTKLAKVQPISELEETQPRLDSTGFTRQDCSIDTSSGTRSFTNMMLARRLIR
jgi:hypothetical protein